MLQIRTAEDLKKFAEDKREKLFIRIYNLHANLAPQMGRKREISLSDLQQETLKKRYEIYGEEQLEATEFNEILDSLATLIDLEKQEQDPIKLKMMEFGGKSKIQELHRLVNAMVQNVHEELQFILRNGGKNKEIYSKINELLKCCVENAKALEIHRIGNGALKQVSVVGPQSSALHVFICVLGGGSGIIAKIVGLWRKAQFFQEFQTIQQIRTRFSAHAIKPTNLAIDQKLVVPEGDALILRSRKGEDFAKILGRSTPFADIVEYGRQFLAGLSLLHSIDYVHGDIKPENALLVDGELRISDYGQSRLLKDGEQVRYTANPWYLPPEGVLSKKGEVYSVGLVLIRMLEKDFLDPKDPEATLVPVPPERRKFTPVSEERRGIERFVVLNAGCTQTERIGLIGNLRVLNQRWNIFIARPSQSLKDSTEREIRKYINELADRIDGALSDANEEKLRKLLYAMTSSDPVQRPSMEDALKAYNEIFPARLLQQAKEATEY